MQAFLAALALAVGAIQGQAFSVDPAGSVIRFHLNHKLHPVDGRSSSIEGKAVVGADGNVLAMVRVPVASFDSGDGNRDANLRETLEAGRHPFVVLKGVTSLAVPWPTGKPIATSLRGELSFHGTKRPVEVPISLVFAADGSVRVTGKLKVSLESFQVERPSLLFVKVDDECVVDVELELRRSGT